MHSISHLYLLGKYLICHVKFGSSREETSNHQWGIREKDQKTDPTDLLFSSSVSHHFKEVTLDCDDRDSVPHKIMNEVLFMMLHCQNLSFIKKKKKTELYLTILLIFYNKEVRLFAVYLRKSSSVIIFRSILVYTEI